MDAAPRRSRHSAPRSIRLTATHPMFPRPPQTSIPRSVPWTIEPHQPKLTGIHEMVPRQHHRAHHLRVKHLKNGVDAPNKRRHRHKIPHRQAACLVLVEARPQRGKRGMLHPMKTRFGHVGLDGVLVDPASGRAGKCDEHLINVGEELMQFCRGGETRPRFDEERAAARSRGGYIGRNASLICSCL
jgi:hypothetical protein